VYSRSLFYSLSTLCVAAYLSPLTCRAADGIWTGAVNTLWTNSANWSASPYPGSATGESAAFDGAGNGNTAIDLDGHTGIRNVSFGADAAAYTLGTDGQTLVLGSTFSLDAGLAAPQTVNAALQLGTDRAAGTYILTNASPALVTLAGGIASATSGGTAGTKSLHIGGNTLVSGVIANGGASGVALTIRRGANTSNTVTLTAANTFSGGITVADGFLVLKNSAALGSGNKTATVANNAGGARPAVWLDGTDGDLDIPASVSWNTSNAKEGALVNIAGNNTVRGKVALTSGDGDTWLISRGGRLTLTGAISASTTDRNLRLHGNADGEISGVIANGSSPNLTVYKDEGAGTWTLSGANTYAGRTIASAGTLEISGPGRVSSTSEINISNGATFRIGNTAAASHADRVKDTASVNLSGSTFDFAGDGGAYTETAGPLALLSGANAVTVSSGASFTFASLSAAPGTTVAFTLGAGAHIFITGQPEGMIGAFATVNSAPAYYDLTAGVIPAPSIAIAAKGDTIPNTPNAVTITAEGTGGPDELAAPVTAVGALVQASPYAATLNTAGKTLKADLVQITENAAGLTLGILPNDGSLTASGQLLTLQNDSASSALTVNAAVADTGVPLALAKTGSGTATLAASNTFSGPVTVLDGALLLAHPLALQRATLTTGGILFDPVPGHAFTVAALTNAIPLALEDTGGNPVTLTAFADVPNATFAGGLTGPGTFVKAGTGTLSLSGANDFTGALVVNAGTVTVTTTVNALGLGDVHNDGVINLTRGNYVYPALSNAISGAGAFNVTLASGSGTARANGDASGFTGVWNVGVTALGGKLDLSGADNSAATVNILSNATLYVTGPVTKHATAVLSGGKPGEQNGQLRVDAGADWAGPVFLAGDHADPGFGLIGSGASTGTISGLIADLPGTGPHALHKQGGGQLHLTHPASTYTGPTWLRSGATGVTTLKNAGQPSSLGAPAAADAAIKLGTGTTATRLVYLGTGDTTDRPLDLASTAAVYLEQSGTGLLKFTAPAIITSVSGNKSLYLQGSTEGAGEIAGTIPNAASGTTTLTKLGSGTWALSAENTFTGAIDIRSGTLSLAHPRAALGASGINVTTAPGGTLSLDNDATDEAVKDYTVGANCPAVALALGTGPSGAAVTHAFSDWAISRVTVTVTRAASVLSGTPGLVVNALKLSAGSPGGDTRIAASGTDITIGSAESSSAYPKTLILDGDTHANAVTGSVANGQNVLSLQKDGPGTWTLPGANTHTGPTTVNAGTLALSGASSSAVTLAGGILALTNTASGVDSAAALGPVAVTGPATLASVTAVPGGTASLTLGGLTTAAALDITGAEPPGESDRNRVFVTGQPDGYLGPWLTLNGAGPVMYSASLGLHLGTGFTTPAIAARGATLPDDATAHARITAPGTSGPDTLAGTSENSLAFLTQTVESATPAVIAMPGKTLKAHGIAIETGGQALTLGTAPGEGTLTALGGNLVLANASEAPLTVNAAVADNGAPVSLASSGDITLAGPAAHTGRTLINGGALTFASDADQTLPGEIASTGTLVKEGTGILHLLATNSFTGPTFINAGTVCVYKNAAFGDPGGGVFIAPGATLDIGGGTNTINLGTEIFTVQGAIINSAADIRQNAFGRIDLAGDATFGTPASASSRFDIRSGAKTLNLNGHTLTKTGPGIVSLVAATVNPDADDAAGAIDVLAGTFRIETDTKLNGSEANTVTLRDGARLEMNNHNPTYTPVWTLAVPDGASARLRVVSGTGTRNTWSGPVAIDGELVLDASGAYSLTVSGPITGPGSLVKMYSHTATISGTNNTYTGSTSITNGTLSVARLANAGQPSSIGAPTDPEKTAIRMGEGSTAATLLYTGDGDTTDRPLALLGKLVGSTTPIYTLNNAGPGRLTFAGGVDASAAGSKILDITPATTGSEIELSGPYAAPATGTFTLRQRGAGKGLFTGTLDLGASILQALSGTAVIEGDLTFSTGYISLGSSPNYSGVVVMKPGASITGTGTASGNGGILIGSNSTGAGAFYMQGGTIATTPKNGDEKAFTVGQPAGSYGYFRMDGGEIQTTRIQTGHSSTSGSNTIGVVRITAGTLTFPDYLLLGRGKGVQSAFTLDGGTLFHTNAANNLSLAYEGGSSDLNLTGGTLDNTGRAITVNQNTAYTSGATGTVNLCAGTLTVDDFQNTVPASGHAVLNFSGGTLAASAASTSFIPANWTGAYIHGPFGAFAGGAVIDSNGKNITVAAPLQAPSGNGVTAIGVADGGLGYIGEPYVEISGDGRGATAVANMEDDGTGSNRWRVASVTITCPGTGYTLPPTVTFKAGGRSATPALAGAATLTPDTGGGLTKRGTGTLTLSAANTYPGPTAVEGGTLKLANAKALPSGTAVTVAADATLDLGGYTVTNDVTGAGTVANGVLHTVISPAGAGAVGQEAFTFSGTTALSGTYILDVTADGASDLITVDGNTDVTGLALTLVDPALLNTAKIYTVAQFNGTRTGTFTLTNAPENWHLANMADNSVKLLFSRGTLLFLR
jgi:autotransporter-associated beta strand protein